MSKVEIDDAAIAETVDTLREIKKAIESVRRAFGAPGDHGYGTRSGDALHRLYDLRADICRVSARLSETGFCAEAWTIVPIVDEEPAA